MNVKKITWISMLLAMCVIGANFKIMGSIALDSFPAFLGAILLGPVYGAFLGVFGHLISALLAGFPLSLPIHFIIAVLMGVCMFAFGWVRKNNLQESVANKVVSWVTGYTINVILTLLVLSPILKSTILVLFVPLTLATWVNLGITEMLYLVLPDRIKGFQKKIVE